MDVTPEHRPLVEQVGLTDPFADPRVRVWRTLADRENATLDATAVDGTPVRLHVKRYPATNQSAMLAERRGHDLLRAAGIATAPLLATGRSPDGRSFAAFLDLAGHTPGDRWLNDHPGGFDRLLGPTADLAAALHAAGLHHRDLYLCHFMSPDNGADLRLIDVTRVGRLSNPLTRRRWVVKDLAQFWYSTTQHDVTDAQRRRWLDRYAERRGIGGGPLRGAIERKAAAIARHDVRLNGRQPSRHVPLVAVESERPPG